MTRLGLCCTFAKAPIRFRRTTATYQAKFSRIDQLRHLSDLCLHNAETLLEALTYCSNSGIGAFRINSQILPLITHPKLGYEISDLPGHVEIVERFHQSGEFAKHNGIRTSFHPDQFVVIASPRSDVRRQSVNELVYQSMVADWVGADVINIHGGGAYGDKTAALKRLITAIQSLPNVIIERLALENDDKIFTPEDLLPVCRTTGIGLTYDVHHHRCLPDSWSIAQATRVALTTWRREPLFHLSSPIERWNSGVDRRHADYIEIDDFPDEWRDLDITVDVEAKAKEQAVEELSRQLQSSAIH